MKSGSVITSKEIEEQKRISEYKMTAFDAQLPELRQLLANAPYGIPHMPGINHRWASGIINDLLRDRDVTGIGPVPTIYKRKRRKRR